MDRPITPYTRDAFLDPGCTIRVKLRWYPAPPGALPYQGYHLFGSGDFSNQAKNRPWPGPGEIKDAKRTFVPGAGPMFLYTGTGTPLGDPSWYIYGVPLEEIKKALANPPGPPPGFLRPDHGPPAVLIDCPRPMCLPNPLCPPHAAPAPAPVLVAGDVAACRHRQKTPALGPVLVAGDVSACKNMISGPCPGPVLVAGDVSATHGRVAPAPALGPVLVAGDVAALRRPPAPAVGPVLVAGDVSACRHLQTTPAPGPVLVAGDVSAMFFTNPDCPSTCCPGPDMDPRFVNIVTDAGCSCLALPDTLITWNNVSNQWELPAYPSGCGINFGNIFIRCVGPDCTDMRLFAQCGTPPFLETYANNTPPDEGCTCSPVFAQWSGLVLTGICCHGTVTVTFHT